MKCKVCGYVHFEHDGAYSCCERECCDAEVVGRYTQRGLDVSDAVIASGVEGEVVRVDESVIRRDLNGVLLRRVYVSLDEGPPVDVVCFEDEHGDVRVMVATFEGSCWVLDAKEGSK